MIRIEANTLIDLLRNAKVENIKIFKRGNDCVLYVNDSLKPITLNVLDLSLSERKNI